MESSHTRHGNLTIFTLPHAHVTADFLESTNMYEIHVQLFEQKDTNARVQTPVLGTACRAGSITGRGRNFKKFNLKIYSALYKHGIYFSERLNKFC
jgi:hypothetical protein